MKTETEVKFLRVDHDNLREKLRLEGGVCEQPMRLMRRAIIATPEMEHPERDGFIRVRDEGHRVTLTYKQFGSQKSLTSAKEIETVVGDFDAVLAIFDQADLKPLSYQESKRETWLLGDCEIVLDEWPWVSPYIEIEGHSEADVKRVAKQLGFSWSDAVFGKVTEVYSRDYPGIDRRVPVCIPVVKFGDPLPKELESHAQ